MFRIPDGSKKELIFAHVASVFICFIGWELDSLYFWNKIRGPKLVQFHPGDMIIPEPAQLYTQIKSKIGTIKIEYQSGGFETRISQDQNDALRMAHNRPMNEAEFKQHINWLVTVVGF